jgi:hypothetical protein
MKSFLKAVVAGVALFWATSSIQAVEIAPGDGQACFLTLSGKVVKGDADKIADAIDKAQGEGKMTGDIWPSVCLDSPGGSFSEGVEIGEQLYERGVGTRVPAGAKCLSACAFMFMGGRVKDDEIDGAFRFLHVKGELAFHAPYIDLAASDLRYTAEEVKALFDQANRVSSRFVGLASQRSPLRLESPVKPSLIRELLAVPRDRMLTIDTVEKAARWGVELYGYRLAIGSRSARFFAQVCESYLKWSIDQEADSIAAVDAETYWTDSTTHRIPEGYDVPEGYGLADFSGTLPRYCAIKLEEEQGDDAVVSICTNDAVTGIRHGACPDFSTIVPDYYGLPPETRISGLAGE